MAEKPSLLCWPTLSAEFFAEASLHFGIVHYADFLNDSQQRPDIVAAILSPRENWIDSKALERLPNLRIVANHGVGTDHIDMPLYAPKGIVVTNTPDIIGEATAETAIMLMLNAARRQREMQKCIANSDWAGAPLGYDICGCVVGIVGVGSIGARIARRCSLGFRATVIYHQRQRLSSERERELGLSEFCQSLSDLASRSDYLVLAVPLNPATKGLVNASLLNKMKSNSIIINVSRGGIVDTDALVNALANKTIAGAGLDVTDPEPLPSNHPLLSDEYNVWVTPHCGTATVQTRGKMQLFCLEQILLVTSGKNATAPVAIN